MGYRLQWRCLQRRYPLPTTDQPGSQTGWGQKQIVRMLFDTSLLQTPGGARAKAPGRKPQHFSTIPWQRRIWFPQAFPARLKKEKLRDSSHMRLSGHRGRRRGGRQKVNFAGCRQREQGVFRAISSPDPTSKNCQNHSMGLCDCTCSRG